MASGAAKIDYDGRTVDLLMLKTILDAPAVRVPVDVDVSNVSGEPMIVTGVEKMVQRYANAFITALGSAKFRDGHGTNLVPSVAEGLVYNMPTLEAVAAEANMMARTQTKEGDEETDEDTPADESLEESEVTGLSYSRERSRVEISVLLTTASGQSYTYIIPVAVGVH